MGERVKGPASYFSSIEKKYGRPVDEWLELIRQSPLDQHMELVNWLEALGGGNRPRVRVTLGGYSYQTTVGRMRGEFLFPVSAAVREQAGVAAGDEIEVGIELDTEPRELEIPAELAAALERDPAVREGFERLSYGNRKRHVLAVEGAKTVETRQRRRAKILDELHAQR